MGGVCAAYKAYQYACTTGFENFEIILINPVPVPELGGRWSKFLGCPTLY